MSMPIVTLTNGLRVGNLCSGHPFTFTDGTVLPACSSERVALGLLKTTEVKVYRRLPEKREVRNPDLDEPRGLRPEDHPLVHRAYVIWEDIHLSFELDYDVIELLHQAQRDWAEGRVDLVLVPFPLMRAMKDEASRLNIDIRSPKGNPFRVIRRDGRAGDGRGEGRTHIDRFCV